MKVVYIILISLGGAAFFWLVVVRILAKVKGGRPCPYAVSWLVKNPLRSYYMSRVLDRVGIRSGERVLELGPGPGAFTVEAARRTQPGGGLVAVDIQPEMISAVKREVEKAALDNVETHVASADQLPLNDNSVDRAFLITVLPEISDKERALAEIYRVIKPGGVLSITEEFLDPDYPLPRTTIRWVENAGFIFAGRHGNWWVYTLNFRKPEQRE
jgi:ubiquinone/menaquinone biosynthesis C-methylase UbiE